MGLVKVDERTNTQPTTTIASVAKEIPAPGRPTDLYDVITIETGSQSGDWVSGTAGRYRIDTNFQHGPSAIKIKTTSSGEVKVQEKGHSYSEITDCSIASNDML